MLRAYRINEDQWKFWYRCYGGSFGLTEKRYAVPGLE